MFKLDELMAARDFVGAILPATAQHVWPLLSERLGAEVVVKHENHQLTGAFKVRGGLVYMDHFVRENPIAVGIASATRGNHGQSIAFAARRFGVPATIFVPKGNSVEKNAAMRAFGATLVEEGVDFQAAREAAIRHADDNGLVMVPSYHRHLVLGVATYALELLQAAPDLDVLYVPIGLGSGISGCILARDLLGLNTRIVGVQSTEAACYALSLSAGRLVSTNSSDTFADGIATRVPDPEALDVLRRGVSHVALVTDEEIAEAIRIYWTDTHNLAEGAGAAPLAAALKERERNLGRKVGLVLTGGNIDLDLFRSRVLGGAGRA